MWPGGIKSCHGASFCGRGPCREEVIPHSSFIRSATRRAGPRSGRVLTLNAEGVRLLRQDKGSGRRAAVTRAVEAAGGKVEAFYFAYGQDNTIIIADYPDAASATAVSLVGNSTGVVRVSMTPLITVEEMDRAVDKAATLPSPGPAR